MRRTNEGALAYEHSLDHCVEFFSKAGSLFVGRGSFYGQEESALGLFQKAWIVDKVTSMKLLFWLRDFRNGGAGNRSGFRECVRWLADFDPEWVKVNLDLIPEYGRWDDLKALFGTQLEEEASRLWACAIRDGNVLATKWCDRSIYQVRKQLGLKVGEFRRLLAKIRKDHIVEHKMCHNLWKEIEYGKVPSIAMARYTNAFRRHDEERFLKYLEDLRAGREKIQAKALFPHDCVRTARYGNGDVADEQFENLPNYIDGLKERIIVISDTSGSMDAPISGSIKAVDISQGLALYCSAKIPEDNPFHKKFIAFCSESEFKNWNGMKFSEAVNNREIFDRAVGATRIDKALDLILKTAQFFNLENDKMPTTLLIVSDMQFHEGCESDETEIERCLKKWDRAGYTRPKIVYWNTAGYLGQQATVTHSDVALISGFNVGILKSLFAGDRFDPKSVMLRAIEPYRIRVPEGE